MEVKGLEQLFKGEGIIEIVVHGNGGEIRRAKKEDIVMLRGDHEV